MLNNEEEVIKTTLDKLKLEIVISYVPIEAGYGTADTLREMRDKITMDMLIISSDVITDLSLNEYIRLYRLKNSTFQCMLSAFKSEKENMVPANKLTDNKELDIIGHDGNEENRLVYFEPFEIGGSMQIKKKFLKT